MRCEICGKPIGDNPIRAKVEGSVVNVCKECSKLGKIQRTPVAPTRFKKPTNSKAKKTANPTPKRSYREPDEIVENYAELIRNARESKKISREVLAKSLSEKTSIINRLESGKMEPDLKLAKKIEKKLNIQLIEKNSLSDLDEFKGGSIKEPTLGDFIKVKRK